MECNKDEAIRAKTIAEKKFADKDFAGAKKFTLKSQTLYPGLDGISQMLITLDVYISSENKINGESDWYGVLDVNPSDDDEKIRKQYKKLVLMLHPDKNRSVGADGAFKILSEAWSLLSDKSKRSAYNHRRNSRGFQHKVSPQSACSSSSSPGVYGVHRATSRTKAWNYTTTTQTCPAWVPPIIPAGTRAPPPAGVRSTVSAGIGARVRPPARVPPTVPAGVRTRASATAPAPAPTVQGRDTFWTICHGCKMHYEYTKVYVNQTLLCPKCHKPFHAVEMAVPINFPKPAGLNNKNKTNICFSRSEVHGNAGPCGVSRVANFVDKVNLKRNCEEFNAQRFSKRRKQEDGGQPSNVKVSYRRSARN